MLPQWFWMLFYLLVLLALLGLTEYLHRSQKFPVEITRKIMHVSGGLLCLTMPLVLRSHWWLLAVAAATFTLLLITYLHRQLQSIHQTKRVSLGSVLFPVPVYACFLIAELRHDWLLFYIPVSLLTLPDTAAEIGGQKWGAKTIQLFGGQKTLAGSASFLLIAWPLVFAWLHFYPGMDAQHAILKAFPVAATAMIAEGVSLHGWDNISVPAVSMLVYTMII